MAAQSSFKNMFLCLSVVSLVCSAILGGIYVLTENPIANAEKAKTAAAIRDVVPSFNGEPVALKAEVDGNVYDCYELDVDGAKAYAVTVSVSSGFGGAFSLMAGFAPDGTISGTSVLVCNETPGLGAKCKEEAFYGQFRGFNPAEKSLAVSKDGGDVDAITAATITSRAYCEALTLAYKVYGSLAGQQSNDGGNDNE